MDQVAEESTRRYGKSIDNLKKAGSTIQELAFEERKKMAMALDGWANDKAKEFDKKGLPASKLFKRYLEIAEEQGVKLPHKYNIK